MPKSEERKEIDQELEFLRYKIALLYEKKIQVDSAEYEFNDAKHRFIMAKEELQAAHDLTLSQWLYNKGKVNNVQS